MEIAGEVIRQEFNQGAEKSIHHGMFGAMLLHCAKNTKRCIRCESKTRVSYYDTIEHKLDIFWAAEER
jgi:hypothetical protein